MEFQRAAIAVQGGGTKRSGHVLVQPFVQPDGEGHIAFFSQVYAFIGFGELPQFLLTFPLCFGENILRLGKAAVIIADDNAALPPAVAALSYGASSAFPFLCQGLSPFPSRSSMKPPTMPLAAFCISGVTWV